MSTVWSMSKKFEHLALECESIHPGVESGIVTVSYKSSGLRDNKSDVYESTTDVSDRKTGGSKVDR